MSEKYQFLKDSVGALVHMRIKHVSHLDIKPANLVVTKKEGKYSFKFADFGMSRKNEESMIQTYAKGTMYYMAPEVKKNIDEEASIEKTVQGDEIIEVTNAKLEN